MTISSPARPSPASLRPPRPLKRVRRVFACCAAAVAALASPAGAQGDRPAALPPEPYRNPIDVLVADPYIHRAGATYYLYGTAADDGFATWTSSNLVDWRLAGQAFRRAEGGWARELFWAPEVFVGSDGKHYLHFSARDRSDRGHRLVLAEADSPAGPFRERRAPWFDPGFPVIDGHVFRDPADGAIYLYAVHLPHPGQPTFEIHARRLNEDLSLADADPKRSTLCIKAGEKSGEAWEGGMVNEGPVVRRHAPGLYVMTYSANGFDEPKYAVGVATAPSPLGPWTKQPGGPVLSRSDAVSGPGHHNFVDSPDGREWFAVYHAHQQPRRPDGNREACIDRVTFTAEPPFVAFDGPSRTPRPLPVNLPVRRGQDDDFAVPELDRERWTVFNESPDDWRLEGGRLVVVARNGDVHEGRSDLANLFLQRAPRQGAFAFTVKVSAEPEADFEQAFAMLWQDHNHFAKVAVVHAEGGVKLEAAVEQGGRYVSQTFPGPAGGEAWLRLTWTPNPSADGGGRVTFSASDDGKAWRDVATLPADLGELRAGFGAASPVSGRAFEAAFDDATFTRAAAAAAPTTPPGR